MCSFTVNLQVICYAIGVCKITPFFYVADRFSFIYCVVILCKNHTSLFNRRYVLLLFLCHTKTSRHHARMAVQHICVTADIWCDNVKQCDAVRCHTGVMLIKTVTFGRMNTNCAHLSKEISVRIWFPVCM